MEKEAQARIKINRLLEEAGWRFFSDQNGKANIRLEASVTFEQAGNDFENAETHDKRKGAIDFLLLDKDGRALVAVEAKRESIDPLFAKEQARNYARNSGARFIILSNGNIHYFWDTTNGNPETISRFPSQDSLSQFERYTPNPKELAAIAVDENYIIETQMPDFSRDPLFVDELTRQDFLKKNRLKQLRPYQLQAVRALQDAAKGKSQRFLFEMATGTGKTFVSAAVIKLFMRSGNARRVLFLVDRLELETQAWKAFNRYLGKDYRCVILKESRDSWQSADIVVTTIQTLMAGDHYKKEFSPTDFEFLISDEAHRSIGNNSRVVFEYFVGYKLGLTATPKNYLKGLDKDAPDTEREYERRVLMDTYKTFGCEAGNPTFSYDLNTGAKEGHLIQPTRVDARTEITTELLSEEGFAVHTETDEGQTINDVFTERDYERKFFNEPTNMAMCKAFIDNGLMDPLAQNCGLPLFGKSIVFCVSQRHAARIANTLNRLAMEKWPDQYGESDFAMQVTSQVQGAQQMTINFANNVLGGKVKRPEGYDSSKTRVCVTVGMMTTGYDCEDLLNIALMRPVFSPSEFVQIKGRGTRTFTFEYEDYANHETLTTKKERYKFFDFFASCEYFENEYPYDEKIPMPRIAQSIGSEPILGPTGELGSETESLYKGPVDLNTHDELAALSETQIGEEGMRIDREGFKKAVEEDVLGNDILKTLWENGDLQGAEDFVKKNIFDKPKYFLNLDKVRRIFGVDRRITIKEFLEYVFGEKDNFETKDDLLEAEWEKFTEIYPVDQEHYAPVKMFFKAYATDEKVREIIASRQTSRFNTESSFNADEYQMLNGYKTVVPQYIHDYAYQLTNL